tara:strand:- start:1977 stop:2900 length:924 start_codon:yes stop_codon:yes gene_type:complete
MPNLAPIALFCYNRPTHLKLTVASLKNNYLANKSTLYIFLDGPKSKKDFKKNNEISDYISKIDGFAKIKIYKRNRNLGLAQSIIKGVNFVLKKNDKIIVVEDDIVTSPYFLNFMNESLNKYKKKSKVWHITGHSHLKSNQNENQKVFFSYYMNCWGWGTWKDRWKVFEKNPNKLIKNFSRKEISEFDLNDTGLFWSQILKNATSKINTWAIFWYATIYKKRKLCCNPLKSYVRNIGMDGSGMHCSNSRYLDENPLYIKPGIKLTSDPFFSKKYYIIYKKYFKSQSKSIIKKMINRVNITLTRRNFLQ